MLEISKINLYFRFFGSLSVSLVLIGHRLKHTLLYVFNLLAVNHYFLTTFKPTNCVQVLVTSLSLENIGYLEPANFWIGPAAVRQPRYIKDICAVGRILYYYFIISKLIFIFKSILGC